jgi:hypothetical protein
VRNWIEQFRALGLALLEVFRAEWEALRGDLDRAKRNFAVVVLLLGAAAVLAFWTLGVLSFLLGAVLAIWLPVWLAALIVFGLYAVSTVTLGILGTRRGKRWMRDENPAVSVRRRLDDHLVWWQESLLREEEPIEVATAGAAGRGSDEPNR